MNTYTFSITKIGFLFTLFISSLFIFAPLAGVANEDKGVIYVDPEKNVVGIFPEEEAAKRITNNLNNGPLAESVNRARVENDNYGGFRVVIESTQVINAVNAGCSLAVGESIARKGQEISFTWQADYGALSCKEGTEGCGTITSVLFQGESVEEMPKTVEADESRVYTLSGEVIDIVTIEDRETEVARPVVCTAEVRVVRFFPWLLWKLFNVQP